MSELVWYSFAVTDDGKVFAWGSNSDCVLGLKKKMDQRKSVKKPTEIALFSAKGIQIEDVSAGS